MNHDSLGNRAFRGLVSVASSTAVVTVARMISLVVLARLLTPEAFGLMALAVLMISLGQLISDLGVSSALVQKPELTPADVSTATVVSLSGSVVLCIVIASSATVIADFVTMPSLASLLVFLAISLVIRGVSLPAEAVMKRDLSFAALARIDVISYMVGNLTVSLGLAVAGFGVWALAVAYMAEAVIRSVLIMTAYSGRTRLGFSGASWRSLWRFGFGLTLAQGANVLGTRGDKAAVGALGDAAILGEYDRAYQLMVMPASIMDKVVSRVLFPALSRVQDDRESLRKNYIRGLGLTALGIIPVAVICLVIPGEIVFTILGGQWVQTPEVFWVLSLAMLFRCTYKLSDEMAQACGAVYRRAWRQGLYAFLVIVGALLASKFGVVAIAWAVTGSIIINALVMTQLGNTLCGASWRDVAFAHRPGIVLGILSGGIAWGISWFADMYAIAPVITVIVVSVSVALLFSLVFVLRPGILGAEAAWLGGLIYRNLPPWAARYI